MLYTDLPHDVHLLFIDTVDTSDFESLVMTCKTLYSLASPRRKKHNALKEKYGIVSIPEDDTPGTCTCAGLLSLVNDIYVNPIVAQYVKRLEFGTCAKQDHDKRMFRKIRHRRLGQTRELSDSVVHLLRNCNILDKQTMDRCIKSLLKGASSPLLGSLLMSLPNLRSLSVQNSYPGDGILETMLGATTSQAHGTVSPHLEQLQELELASVYLVDGRAVLDYVPLLALPSLKRFNVQDLNFNLNFRPFQPTSRLLHEHKPSGLEEVMFDGVLLNNFTLTDILKHNTALKKFRCSYTDMYDDGVIFHVGDELQASAKTLEQLVWTPRSFTTGPPLLFDLDNNYLSFRLFQNLRSLVIDLKALQWYSGTMDECASWTVERAWEQYRTGAEIAFDKRSSRLVDILPASLQHLALNITGCMKQVSHVFSGLSEAKRRDHMQLNKITLAFELYDDLPFSVLEQMHLAGIRYFYAGPELSYQECGIDESGSVEKIFDPSAFDADKNVCNGSDECACPLFG